MDLLDSEGKPVPPGVVGEIVATGLHNLAMPLIRYRTGDMGVWSTKACPCGQPFPILEKIKGRTTDYLIRRDGSLVSGTVAMFASEDLGTILYLQVIQSEIGRVEFRLVKGEGYREPEHTEYLVGNLRDRLGDDTVIDVRFCGVEDLERNPIGKIRYCYNKIKKGQGSGLSAGDEQFSAEVGASGM